MPVPQMNLPLLVSFWFMQLSLGSARHVRVELDLETGAKPAVDLPESGSGRILTLHRYDQLVALARKASDRALRMTTIANSLAAPPRTLRTRRHAAPDKAHRPPLQKIGAKQPTPLFTLHRLLLRKTSTLRLSGPRETSGRRLPARRRAS
jgi:hypothetical protein